MKYVCIFFQFHQSSCLSFVHAYCLAKACSDFVQAVSAEVAPAEVTPTEVAPDEAAPAQAAFAQACSKSYSSNFDFLK